jgi:hypothetical protein
MKSRHARAATAPICAPERSGATLARRAGADLDHAVVT